MRKIAFQKLQMKKQKQKKGFEIKLSFQKMMGG